MIDLKNLFTKRPTPSFKRPTLQKEDTSPKGKKNITKESTQEVGEKLRKIRENEKKFRELYEMETGAGFYFQVLFKNEDELKKFLIQNRIKLEYGDFVFYDDIKHLFEK